MPKRILHGQVVSTKMQKTVVVAVDTLKRHPAYNRLVKTTKRYKAHDELGVEQGAFVNIEESRPLSKEVHWVVKEVVEKSN